MRSGEQDHPGQHGETLSTKNTEAGELLEPGRWRLQGAKIVLLHSSLGDTARLHLSKNTLHNLSVRPILSKPPHGQRVTSDFLLKLHPEHLCGPVTILVE